MEPRKTPALLPDGELREDLPPDELAEPILLEKPKRKNQDNRRLFRVTVIGGATAVIYGIFARLVFGSRYAIFPTVLFSELSGSFLVLVPMGIGALSVAFTPRGLRASYRYGMLTAFVACCIFMGLTAITALEVSVCLVMASPIFLTSNAVGAALMTWLLRQIDRQRFGGRSKNYALIGMLVIPFLMGPLETRFAPQDSIREVHTWIAVKAPAEKVWPLVTRVSAISPEEYGLTWSGVIGIPRPNEANLSYDGIGGVRDASYVNGLQFSEVITDWQPPRTLTFTIKLAPNQPIPTPFDQIGGETFDVLDAQYALEPTAGGITLHLTSHERVTTRYNAYSTWWTDFIMRDLQDGILRVIKARAER